MFDYIFNAERRAERNLAKAKKLEHRGWNAKRAYLKAGRYYEKAGHLAEAAECYEKGGNFEKASGLYLNLNEFQKLARLFVKQGKFEDAKVWYGTEIEANRLAALEAFHMFKDVDEKFAHRAMARYCALGGETESALFHANKAEDFGFAGQLAEKLGLYAEAADLYSKSAEQSDLAKALDVLLAHQGELDAKLSKSVTAKVAGRLEGQPELVDRLVDVYRKEGRLEDAIDVLERFGKDERTKMGELYADYCLELAARKEWGEAKRYRQAALEKLEKDSDRYVQLGQDYVVIDEIDSGAMGEISLAWDTKYFKKGNNRLVALKRISREGDTELLKEQLEEEIDSLEGITDYSHIVRIFYSTSYKTPKGEEPCLVMEYLEGDNLDMLIKNGSISDVQDAIEIFIGVAKGLKAAHDIGLVHRDVKPSNVIVVEQDDKKVAKLLDFGVAYFTKKGDDRMAGSPAYMAPEQWKAEASAQSDIYSFGLVMQDVLRGLDMGTPARLCDYDPEVVAPFRKNRADFYHDMYDIIRECLDLDSTKRPTADQLITKLENLLKKYDFENPHNHDGNTLVMKR